MYNVICLKYGLKYSSEYVNNLYNMTHRFCSLPFRFVCFTENTKGIDPHIETQPLLCDQPNVKGWWHKLSFFQKKIRDLEGTALFLDLDLVVINGIEKFFEYPGEFLAIWDWIHGPSHNIFNSSVMRWQIGEQTHIWNQFNDNPGQVMVKYPGDQEFISNVSNLTPWPENWCASYKWQQGWETIHPQTSIMVFHGKPNPPEAIRGIVGYPPAPWIRNFWR
jgi:hypothetical protein